LKRLLSRNYIAVRLAACAILLGAAGCQTNSARQRARAEDALEVPAPGPNLTRQPASATAREVFVRMIDAYKRADSLYLRTEADVLTMPGPEGSSHQVSLLRYRRQPAAIRLWIRDPNRGMQEFFADGSSLVHWDGLDNLFTRRDCQGDVIALASAIEKQAPQPLSPLVFLRANSMPTRIAKAAILRTESVNGNPSYRIQGSFDSRYLLLLGKQLGYGPDPLPLRGRFTIWVDSQSYLIRKCALSLAWCATIQDEYGRTLKVTPTLQSSERLVKVVPNPAYAPDDFRFLPPKGAQEKFAQAEDTGSAVSAKSGI
jgi:hypothetical protein